MFVEEPSYTGSVKYQGVGFRSASARYPQSTEHQKFKHTRKEKLKRFSKNQVTRFCHCHDGSDAECVSTGASSSSVGG